MPITVIEQRRADHFCGLNWPVQSFGVSSIMLNATLRAWLLVERMESRW
jgi:hypothetical protein